MDEHHIQQAHSETQLYQISNISRLKRFCVLGSETSTYRASDKADNITENIECVRALLEEGHHQEVINILREFSLSGRIAKEDPILTVLAYYSVNDREAVRKEALNAVVDICNIPTKLFTFLDISQKYIDKKRETKKPKPQPKENAKKRKIREETQYKLESLNFGDEEGPSEHPSKKAKKKKNSEPYKPINPAGKKTSGWGRMRRKAIGKFYSDEEKNACRLLYLMTKYKQRHGWCHKDVLVYSHPKVTGKHKHAKDLAIKYCTKGMQYIRNELDTLKAKPGIAETESLLVDYIEKLETVHNLSPESEEHEETLLNILRTHGVRDQKNDLSEYSADVAKDKDGLRCPVQIVREHLPSGFLNSKKDMPMTCLIRNLGKMTNLKLFDEQKNLQLAVESMTNEAKLKKARVHPIKILKALETYRKGSGDKEYKKKDKEKLSWIPNQEIMKALNDAYYKSFMAVDLRDALRTNKKYMLCLNVSESMFDEKRKCVGCETLTLAQASFAMAWVTWNVEDDANVKLMAFGSGSTFENMKDLKGESFNFRRDMKLDEVINKAEQDFSLINPGAPDYSLPMRYAQDKHIETDAFIIYTDNVYTDDANIVNEAQVDRMLPEDALRKYNVKMRRNAKLIVVGMTSNKLSIAKPRDDRNMLDVVGFDTKVPNIISMFVRDEMF